jgi:hypothetical protein
MCNNKNHHHHHRHHHHNQHGLGFWPVPTPEKTAGFYTFVGVLDFSSHHVYSSMYISGPAPRSFVRDVHTNFPNISYPRITSSELFSVFTTFPVQWFVPYTTLIKRISATCCAVEGQLCEPQSREVTARSLKNIKSVLFLFIFCCWKYTCYYVKEVGTYVIWTLYLYFTLSSSIGILNSWNSWLVTLPLTTVLAVIGS